MPVDVLVETTISRPPADVAAFAADPSNAPQWYTNIRSVTGRPGLQPRIGSRMDSRPLPRAPTRLHLRDRDSSPDSGWS